MDELRTFMFDHVYLGPTARARAREDRAHPADAVRLLRRGPDADPRRRRRAGRRPGPAGHRLARGHDRPLLHPRVRGALGAGGLRAVRVHRGVARARPRRGRHGRPRRHASRAAPGGRQPDGGPVPVPRRAHAVVRHQPVREALLLLRLRAGRRPVQVRRADRGAAGSRRRWSRSPSATASSSSPSRRIPQAAERRKERERLLELLERTATFYVRYLWESGEAAGAREYLAERGLDEGALREFRVGYAPSAWDKVLVASRRAGFSDRELVATPGWPSAATRATGGTYDRFRRRIMFPLCDGARARARLRRAGDGRRPEAQVPELLRQRGLPQGPHALRRRHRARGGGEGERGRRRRGLHRRHRACTRPGCATPSGSWAPR